MADALVSIVLERLASIMEQEITKELRLVRGVKKEIQSLTSTLQALDSVLMDAERKQVSEENVRLWLEKLKDVSYDIDDVLDKWSTAILQLQIKEQVPQYTHIPKKVHSHFLRPCLCFIQLGMHHKISLDVKDVNSRLDMIAKEKERYNFTILSANQEHQRPRTTSSIDISMVYGRDDSKKTLVRNLCDSSQGERSLHVLAIVGMGGVGKTTLAQLAYDHNEVKNHFEKRLWVCVSEPFDEIRIAKAIIEALEGATPNIVEFENILHHMRESIAGKRFILVLDDVWTEDYNKWEPLRNSLNGGAQGSKILVTTRSDRVAMMMETIYTMHLEEMSNEDCWSIFSQIALNGRSREECEKLEEISRSLVERCKGLPLAAKVLGGLMRFKNKEDWRSVLDSDLWELEEAKRDIISPLWLSYYDLPSAIKRCFSYCAMFPKDTDIYADRLIRLWMANGFLSSRCGEEMEALGQEYFEILAMRSLFQDLVKDRNGRIFTCKMHDIVHDCAQFLTRNECQATTVNRDRFRRMDLTYGKLRHSTMSIHAADNLLGIKHVDINGLHTLLLEGRSTQGLFDRCTHLRALELHGCTKVSEFTHLGKLIHLRYLVLDLLNKMKELPETVCDLCNLQTLKLIKTSSFEKLPRGIGKLVNLRHLVIPFPCPLRRTPKGIGGLRSLRTLQRFIVSGKNDAGDGCTIRDLQKLNCLRGDMGITGIGNVPGPREAKRAKLKNKTNLRGLLLSFDTSGEEEEEEEEAEEAEATRHFLVIEALEPPPLLESLEIRYYSGTEFPSWISSLSNLKQLFLTDCPNIRAFAGNLQAVPVQHLMITKCPHLESLPHGLQTKLLQELRIDLCPILEQRCRMETGDFWPLISHIPYIYVADRRLRRERQH